ncbi:MAG: hypothetical protein JSW26_17635 [Desulfobacterales bacterium]|nr:MAG: hypothetical protein JSW26_17635 [Desulfobacterales bacterium]
MKTLVNADNEDQGHALELRKLKLEEKRIRNELLKWITVAIGAVVSFYVIDLGKLRLEEFRVKAENQRELLTAYLKATESVQPDVWKRKLHVLRTISSDEMVRRWSEQELKHIEQFAALEALYRETLKVASQLVVKHEYGDWDRKKARARFEQLYWADLVFAGESLPVEKGMVDFRNALIAVEEAPDDDSKWRALNMSLLKLSQVLKESRPNYSLQAAQ